MILSHRCLFLEIKVIPIFISVTTLLIFRLLPPFTLLIYTIYSRIHKRAHGFHLADLYSWRNSAWSSEFSSYRKFQAESRGLFHRTVCGSVFSHQQSHSIGCLLMLAVFDAQGLAEGPANSSCWPNANHVFYMVYEHSMLFCL